MRTTLAAIVASIALLLSPAGASAAVPGGAQVSALGVAPSLDVQIAPLAAPSAAHPWGTIAMAWCVEGVSSSQILAGEWDLEAARMVRTRALASTRCDARDLRLVRSRELLFLAASYSTADAPQELLRLGLDLVEQERVSLAEGSMASLVGGDRFVALGSYEDGRYHVRVFDPETLEVLGARKLQGEARMIPWPRTERSAHALRLEAGRLYVALANQDPKILGLRLPSLATEVSYVFPMKRELRWLYTGVPLAPPPSPLAFDFTFDGRLHVLSNALRPLRVEPLQKLPASAPQPPEGAGERVAMVVHGRSVIVGKRGDDWVLSVGPAAP